MNFYFDLDNDRLYRSPNEFLNVVMCSEAQKVLAMLCRDPGDNGAMVRVVFCSAASAVDAPLEALAVKFYEYRRQQLDVHGRSVVKLCSFGEAIET